MRRALTNLISNAIRYHSERPLRIHVSACECEGEVCLRVADFGIGIPPEHHERVFTLLHRVDPEASEGSGLGLAIVARIAALHGGRASLESEVGEGSTFSSHLPCESDVDTATGLD